MEQKGNTPIDPTANVKELVETEKEHTREIMRLYKELTDTHFMYHRELRIAESSRLDAIRATDVGALALANERAAAQASLLATQLQQYDERNRNLVASTATTIATQITQLINPLVEKVGQLERYQYENKGTDEGKEKMSKSIIAIIGVVILILGFVIANFFKKP